jgi:Beta-galactosidase
MPRRLRIAVLVGAAGVVVLTSLGGVALWFELHHPLSTSPPASVPSGGQPVKILDYIAPPDVPPETFRSRASNQLRDPMIYGISLKFRWSTLEPGDGRYDWSLIDQAISLSAEFGKKVVLRVYSGLVTPDWAYANGAAAFTFTNSDLSNPQQYPGGTLRMPLPWDDRYLAEWTAFVSAFGARYDGNPHIYMIEMAGGGVIGEMCLPHSTPAIVGRWRAAGYSDAADIGAWKRVVDAYRAAFPGTPTALDLCEPLGRNVSNVMKPVAEYALGQYPGRVYLQQNGLQASYSNGINDVRSILRAAATRTVVGYQMYGGAGTNLDEKTGDRRTAFQVAIEDGAQYVEVYQGDLADPANQPALEYLASGGRAT